MKRTYYLCHRKLWLFSHQIQMEHTSALVAEGNLIGENSYNRRHGQHEQIELKGVKIDFYDRRTQTIHETKKSNKVEHAHIALVKYYIWLLEQEGIHGAYIPGHIDPPFRQADPL